MSAPDWRGYQLPRATGYGDSNSLSIEVPIWPLALLSAGCSILIFAFQTYSGRRCRVCNYPVVRPDSTTCPECGTAVRRTGREAGVVGFWLENRKLLLAGAGLLAVHCAAALLTGVVALLGARQITIVIPRGYRGDAVVAKQQGASAPVVEGRSVRFVIPATGLLWASETSYLQRYSSNVIRCVEDDGTVLAGNQRLNGGSWCFTQGPYGSQQIYIISIRDNEGNTEPFVPGESIRALIDHGLPKGFVPPHMFRNRLPGGPP